MGTLFARIYTDASHVEVVKYSLLPGICGLGLDVIQRCAGNADIADCYICCLQRQRRDCPASSRNMSKTS